MSSVTRRAATLPFFVAALLLCLPALALTGTVTDEGGEPLEGARVCYFVDYIEELCSLTTDAGYFELPDSELDTIRIVATGYLPLKLPAVEQDRPIALKPAASILVRLVDAETGEGIVEGKVEILHASGQVRRFPSNRAGVRVRTYEPGLVTVTGRAEGYRPVEPRRVELVAGEESEVEIRMERQDGADAEGDGGDASRDD